MRNKATTVAGIGILALTLGACGGGGGGHDMGHEAHCSPHGSALHVSAADSNFDTDCLAAPAGEAFTIVFENKDASTPHNISIYTEMGGDALFKGDIFNGVETTAYHVPALEAGTYHFHCDVHPAMDGTFIVQ